MLSVVFLKVIKNQVMNITVCFKLSMWGFFLINWLKHTKYRITVKKKKIS